MRRTGLLILAVSAVVVAAPASALTRVDLVVIGDSLMDPDPHACTGGCVSFVNRYAFYLRDTFGVDTYSYAKALALGVPDAVQLVKVMTTGDSPSPTPRWSS